MGRQIRPIESDQDVHHRVLELGPVCPPAAQAVKAAARATIDLVVFMTVLSIFSSAADTAYVMDV